MRVLMKVLTYSMGQHIDIHVVKMYEEGKK